MIPNPPTTSLLAAGGSMHVACGNCGGNVYMVTCNHFRATGHEWVIVGICMICRAAHWTDGCPDCEGS